MIGLIYKKQMKMSNATNKKFSTGEIINFVQIDAQKLYNLSGLLPQVATIPVIITFCVIVLFHKLRWAFLAGLAIMITGIFINFLLSKCS